MDAKLIVLNGKTYRSIEEMPPDVREKYELAMCLLGDGDEGYIPNTFDSRNILVDGKGFNGTEDLPSEARARYEKAITKLDASQNGIPDFVEGMINATNQTANISTGFGTEPQSGSGLLSYPPAASTSQAKPLPVSPTIEPDTSNGWMLAFAGLLLALLCVVSAVGVWYFLLR